MSLTKPSITTHRAGCVTDRPPGNRLLGPMKRLMTPLTVGVGATRHLIWYLSYQITGETREAAGTERT